MVMNNSAIPSTLLKETLDQIYSEYNRFEYIDPDPLLFLHEYPDPADREITGLIAASFAYGQVSQIMKTVTYILDCMDQKPYYYVTQKSEKEMKADFRGFRYRFAGEEHLIGLLMGIQKVIKQFGSLENCFCKGWSVKDQTVVPGMIHLCSWLDPEKSIGHLLADPEKTSACKRNHLFLRWMVRKDSVDPGGWRTISPSQLIIPVDRHIHRIGGLLGFTRRNNADFKTALEITDGFRKISPDDPVKYDFCLSRFGIRRELSIEKLQERVMR